MAEVIKITNVKDSTEKVKSGHTQGIPTVTMFWFPIYNYTGESLNMLCETC